MSHSRDSLVLELQELATEQNVDLTTLLRKALLVATKLNLPEFKNWLECELNGYYKVRVVPEYRKVFGQVWVKNPYHGLVPVMFPDSRTANAYCSIECRDPIGSLKHLLTNRSNAKSTICYPLTEKQTASILEQQDGLNLPPVRTVSENQIASILDSVRTTILEWALRLEKEGILGNGMTFSQKEVERAAASPQIRIENFQGILGNVQDSTVSQNISMNVQKGEWGSLERYLNSSGLSGDDINQLKMAITADGSPSDRKNFGTQVSNWVGKMVAKAASGAWQTGIGAAGNLLSSAISAYYGWA